MTMRRPNDLRLEPLPSFEAARADWTRLAEARGSIFGTWEWASEWWQVFGEERRLLLEACLDGDGRVVGVVPLYLAAERPLRVARFVGHGPADELAPVCAPEDRAAVARAVTRAVRLRLGRRGVVLAERLPGEEGWPALMDGGVLRDESSPRLPIAGRTWDEWLATRSSNFRQQVGRRERKLCREHEVSFRLVEDAASLDSELDVLLELHAARWGSSSSAFSPARRTFHRAFARRALENGWLRLWFVDVDGQPAAGWLGFRYGGVEWYYQAGRDPALADDNVGFVLLTHTIREAFVDGMREYRFGLGAEPYKARFSEQDPGLDTVLLGAAPLPRLASLGARSARRAPPAVRRLLLARAPI